MGSMNCVEVSPDGMIEILKQLNLDSNLPCKWRRKLENAPLSLEGVREGLASGKLCRPRGSVDLGPSPYPLPREEEKGLTNHTYNRGLSCNSCNAGIVLTQVCGAVDQIILFQTITLDLRI